MGQIFIYSILALGILGLLFGLGLAVASHIFYVKMDKRVEQVYKALPDLNCGACGYAGCKKYADAIVNHGEAPNLCTPGGSECAEHIAAILGLELTATAIKKVAHVFCCGGKEANLIYDYQGVYDCNAAVIITGGPLKCDYGCMGFLSCLKACKFDAIRVTEEGMPEIIPEKCTGCEACVKACPKNIIRMIPINASVFVQCNSRERGKDVRDACSRGCIGCTKCVKECPVNAISMDEGLAIIDHSKCITCLKCIKVCPVQVIHHINPVNEKERICQQS
jgi:Na+-translocating ferredoxin:NAD+ oxidoreductase RNF subunit RnfB